MATFLTISQKMAIMNLADKEKALEILFNEVDRLERLVNDLEIISTVAKNHQEAVDRSKPKFNL